jgi:ABC-type Zn uptake system ZnuABC Zn-binding protein ZnuA
MSRSIPITIFIVFTLLLSACQAAPAVPGDSSGLRAVLAVAPYLADIAQNVAGERFLITSLIPQGVDPHVFEPTPGDVARVASSQVLIINGGGLEEFLDDMLANAGGERLIIEAASGLASRDIEHDDEHEDEHKDELEEDNKHEDEHEHDGDPHFWLDPNLVIHYVENIRDGLSQADPAGAEIYAANAQAYIERLNELDAWIREQVDQIPPERRLLVTNHDSFGYFADRYGFDVIGTIIPSVATGASPSARDMASLIDHIRESGAPSIFLETGANPRLAEQISLETGVKVAPPLFSHSTTEPDGPAPNYISMMRYNTQVIVDALK